MSRRRSIHVLLAAGLLPCPSALPAQDDAPPSIEELTQQFRERSEAAMEARRAEVEYLLAQLADHSKADRRNSMEQTRARIISLGSEIAPLLIGSLDPGNMPDRTLLSFSSQVAMVLEGFSILTIHDSLIQMARYGSPSGRRLAIRVLGYSEDGALVSPVLRELYDDAEAPPLAAILTALARLGGAENLDFVTDRLRSEEPTEVDAALYALSSAKVSEAADHILVFAANTRGAAAHAKQLCRWYEACPAAFDKQHGASVLELVKSFRINVEDRIALVNVLSAHERHWPSHAKKTLAGLADTGNDELREAVLIALVLAGDRGAKKDLLEPYEAQTSRNSRNHNAWISLATIEYKIHEYRDAIRHYSQAVNGRLDTRRQRDAYLGLARCYALQNKYKDAKEWLNRAPISRQQLTALAEDPDFVEMAAHTRYRQTFIADED